MVLLAGLVSETQNKSRSGIPGLDQLPVVGGAFGSTGKTRSRTELIILIKPQIIHDSVDASRVAEQLRAKMRGGRIDALSVPNALQVGAKKVSLIGGLLLAFGAAVVASFWVVPGWGGLMGAALAALMLAIVRADWRCYRVPDRLNALALALRGADILLSAAPKAEAAMDAIAGAALASAAFYLFRLLYGWLRGREGLGLGDVKLAAVAGAWVDLHLLAWVVEAAAISGLALALTRGRSGLRADARMPFAVGFAPAIWLGWWLDRLGF